MGFRLGFLGFVCGFVFACSSLVDDMLFRMSSLLVLVVFSVTFYEGRDFVLERFRV